MILPQRKAGAMRSGSVIMPACPRNATFRSMYKTLVAFLLAAALASGCVYSPNIKQGNYVTQKKIDQLKVGMSREQVQFLFGTPMVNDPFHKNRWDFVYFLTPHDGSEPQRKHIVVYFSGDKVSRIEHPES
jgi:outer membrane protein assembly factor BamE